MNTKNASAPESKWLRAPLKSSWYEDHVGYDASPREHVENRLRNFEAKFPTHDGEGGGSRDIERFFDLFEPRGG